MGTATARQLGKAVPALTEKLHLAVGTKNVAISGAHTRLLLNLGFDGAIVRGRPGGSWNNSEYPWSVAELWLPGGIAGEDVDTGAAELARNYLARFGPATARRSAVVGGLDGRHHEACACSDRRDRGRPR